jgi:argininosuccinate lyase
MKLWGGRFSEATNQLVEVFNASIAVDIELAKQDFLTNVAHAQMLGKTGIISHEESETLVAGLLSIAEKFDDCKYQYTTSDEDIHTYIERLLYAEIGDLAGKLHTARSRNDQVATDTRLYLREQQLNIAELLIALQSALIDCAQTNIDCIIPGYTHLQRAQPILFSHHLLAYVVMFARDTERLIQAFPRTNQSPLGACALAGTTFPIDRHFVADLLKFSGVCENSLDAVSDRDYAIEYLSHGSLIMMHLSRLCEELILWSSQEFNFIELADGFCTGSSIMPQKKNPDVPELIRGQSGRVYGALVNMLTMMKGLPLAYNKDMQEDKAPLFQVSNTLTQCLSVCAPLISSMTVKGDHLKVALAHDFINATDLADYLVTKGIPFRRAHHITGEVVRYCMSQNKYLLDCTLPELQQFAPEITADVSHALAITTVVNKRTSFGGTAPVQVEQQLKRCQATCTKQTQQLQVLEDAITFTDPVFKIIAER